MAPIAAEVAVPNRRFRRDISGWLVMDIFGILPTPRSGGASMKKPLAGDWFLTATGVEFIAVQPSKLWFHP
jgi:hypothetical protein